jgi:hypothetical protein
MSRFVNLNHNERLLKDMERQLDNAYRNFLVRRFGPTPQMYADI